MMVPSASGVADEKMGGNTLILEVVLRFVGVCGCAGVQTPRSIKQINAKCQSMQKSSSAKKAVKSPSPIENLTASA